MKQAEKDGLRLAIVIFVASVAGYGLLTPYMPVNLAQNIIGACKWAALTSNAINASVLAKVAKQGTERVAGTIVGGFLGHVIFMLIALYVHVEIGDHDLAGIFLALAAAFAAYCSVTLGSKYKLPYATKLANTTFLLVTFGSVSVGIEGSRLLAISRVIGISCGVLLVELGSMLIFPKSATEASLEEMGATLHKLCEMNRVAWGHGPLYQPEWLAAWKRQAQKVGEAPERLPSTDDYWSMDPAARERKYEEECESVLSNIYGNLQKVGDLLPLTKAEIFVGVWMKKLFFLPGNPFYPVGWHLPDKDMKDLANHVRKIARGLYTLHLSFTEGFDEHMVEMLSQNYPRRLMPALAQTCQEALDVAANAFPNSATLDPTAKDSFAAVGEGLLRISDYQRRRILQHMKHTRTLRKRMFAQEASRPPEPPLQSRDPPSPQASSGLRTLGSMFSRKRPFVRAASLDGARIGRSSLDFGRSSVDGRDVERGMQPVREELSREPSTCLSNPFEDDLTAPLLPRPLAGEGAPSRDALPSGVPLLPNGMTDPVDIKGQTSRANGVGDGMPVSETAVPVGSPSEALANLPNQITITTRPSGQDRVDRAASFIKVAPLVPQGFLGSLLVPMRSKIKLSLLLCPAAFVDFYEVLAFMVMSTYCVRYALVLKCSTRHCTLSGEHMCICDRLTYLLPLRHD
eukprot:jgi/Botrbrau1/17374/Bobra.0494s0001.1